MDQADALDELRELEAVHQRRVPRVRDGALGAVVLLDGRDVLNFASNDYLGLAGDPRLIRAAAAALADAGTGARCGSTRACCA